MCISFKLETDTSILEKKAKAGIEKYGMDMVIANILSTRRQRVYIYYKSLEKPSPEIFLKELRLSEEGLRDGEVTSASINLTLT
jgi:hypothetical protein